MLDTHHSLEPPLPWPTLESLITESSEPPRWLVRDLFYQQSLIILAGMPGVGKSIFAYSASIAIASGQPFLGLPCTPGRVLYFDEENGPANMPTYFRWAWRGVGSPNLPDLAPNFRLGQNAILSHNGNWFDCVLEEARTFRPNLIVFDTATKCCRIRDENDNAEATRVTSQLRLIQAAADANTTLLILKHARIDRDPKGERPDSYRIRGASAWQGDCDGTIFHIASPGRPHAGLRKTHLIPEKTRAFGLRNNLTLIPTWTSDQSDQAGINLAAEASG